MGSHRGSHHRSSSSHSGSHHSSSSSHSGRHHSSSGRSSGSSTASYSNHRTNTYKYKASSTRYYSDDSIPVSAINHNGTWYMKDNGCEYTGINMDDPYVAEHFNKSKISWFYKISNQRPALAVFLCQAFMASIIIAFALAGTNVFYELLIPFFENADMTDIAFFIADECIYYGQYVFAILWMITIPYIVIKRGAKSKQYEIAFAKEVLQHYDKLKKEREIKYLDICPSCGGVANYDGAPAKYCEYCGRSLQVNE